MNEPLFSRKKIDAILDTVPKGARCCYTGQSILAYCPNPTFSWEEVNNWPDQTDVDIFVYNKPGLSTLVQAFMDRGWEPASSIDEFKAERIRFFDSPKKYNLQTVGLIKPDMPVINLTWHNESNDVIATIKRFDMDYLMVGMDIRTKQFVDLRGPDHRVANVNHLNSKFDIDDVDIMFWLRQFDRIPKGYARGVDTRPVAQQYLTWLEETIVRGDKGLGSKTRFYAERKMNQVIDTVIAAGFTKEQAEAMYHMFRGEDNTWEAMKLNLETMHSTISDWLTSVKDD